MGMQSCSSGVADHWTSRISWPDATSRTVAEGALV